MLDTVPLPSLQLRVRADVLVGSAFPDVDIQVVMSSSSPVTSLSPPVAVQAVTSRTSLVPCGLGFGLNELSVMVGAQVVDAVECIACPSGTFSSTVALEPCTPNRGCNANSISLDGGNVTDGATGLKCLCDTGFTARGYDSDGLVLCERCPSGGRCARGLGPPVPAPGFYADPKKNDTFVQCKRVRGCPGGSLLVQCATGYHGYMCNECDDDYYSNSIAECIKCPPAAMGGFVAGVLVLLGLGAAAAVLVSIGVVRMQSSESLHRASMDVLRQRSLPATVGMVVMVFQIMGILSTGKYGWSDEAQSVLSVFNAANVDVNLFASECSLASFHTKYVVSIALPIVVLGAVVVGLLILKGMAGAGMVPFRLRGLASARIRILVDAALFTVTPVLYIPMARATLVMFDCVQLPNGDFVLDVDPGVACFDSGWLGILPVGLVGLVSFVFGFPLYFLFSLVTRRSKLLQPATFVRFGGLYKLFRVSYYWGGMADLGKRLAIVLTSVFLSEVQLVQLGLLMAILLVWVYLVVKTQPYYFRLYNEADVRLTYVIVVMVGVSSASYAERANDGASQTGILVVLVLAVVALCALAAHAIVRDVLQIVSDSYSSSGERAMQLSLILSREQDDLEGEVAEVLEGTKVRLSLAIDEEKANETMGLDGVALDEL